MQCEGLQKFALKKGLDVGPIIVMPTTARAWMKR